MAKLMSEPKNILDAELIEDASQWGHAEPVLCLGNKVYGAMIPMSRLDFGRLRLTFDEAAKHYEKVGKRQELFLNLLDKASERERLMDIVAAVKAGETVDIDEYMSTSFTADDMRVLLEFMVGVSEYCKKDSEVFNDTDDSG